MSVRPCKCGCGLPIPDDARCEPFCSAAPMWVYDSGGDGPNGYACDRHDAEIMGSDTEE